MSQSIIRAQESAQGYDFSNRRFSIQRSQTPGNILVYWHDQGTDWGGGESLMDYGPGVINAALNAAAKRLRISRKALHERLQTGMQIDLPDPPPRRR